MISSVLFRIINIHHPPNNGRNKAHDVYIKTSFLKTFFKYYLQIKNSSGIIFLVSVMNVQSVIKFTLEARTGSVINP